MGIDLVQIGNHNIKFKERDFKELADELKYKLNNINFVNAEYLRLFALHWENSEPRRVRLIRQIRTKKEWTNIDEDPEYYTFAEDNYIAFDGPFQLSLTFYEHNIYFFNPPVRYRQWIGGNELEDFTFRNEWRKYMYQIVKAFGGDRVIYLANNAHPLDGFADMEVPFEEVEKALKEKFGEPVKTFKELEEKSDSSYMIDYLQDIDWNHNLELDSYYPEPNDLTSIEYNLSEFQTKEQLEDVAWDDEALKHKIIDGKLHFFHITRFQGVLVYHTGVIGEEDKIGAALDEYAPFTFDKQEEQMEADGYTQDLEKSYFINFYKSDHRWAWHEAVQAFERKLPWTGNGWMGGGFFGKDETTHRFYAVNEKLALDLLLSLGEMYKVKAPIEVVRHEDKEDQKTIILKR